MTTTYGAYFEGGPVEHTGSELQPLVEYMLANISPTKKVDDLRVGEMKRADVADYVDIDYILEYLENGDILSPYFLMDMVATQYHDVVEDGSAYLIKGHAAFQDRSLFDTDKGYAEWAVRWVKENVALDPEEFCDGEPVKTMTLYIPTVVLAPTVSQVRKWLTSQGWAMTPLRHPFEKWTRDTYWTQVPVDETLSDWCEVIHRWITRFAELSKYTGTPPMTEEYIYRSIMKETP